MIHQLCRPLCVPALCSIGKTFTPYGLTSVSLSSVLGLGADNECAPDCQKSLDGKNIEAMEHYTHYVAGVSAR